MEERRWKPFRTALDKSDRKKFDEMFDIPKSYISACSNSVHYVRLHPILMSILFHHYKQLTECTEQVEQMEDKEGLLLQQEIEQEEDLLPRQLKLSEF